MNLPSSWLNQFNQFALKRQVFAKSVPSQRQFNAKRHKNHTIELISNEHKLISRLVQAIRLRLLTELIYVLAYNHTTSVQKLHKFKIRTSDSF